MTSLLLLLILAVDHPTGPIVRYAEFRQDTGYTRQIVAQGYHIDGKPSERSEYTYSQSTRMAVPRLIRRTLYGPPGYQRHVTLLSVSTYPFLDSVDEQPLVMADGTSLGYRICRDPWDGQPGDTVGWRLINRYGNVEIEHELTAAWSFVQTMRRVYSDTGRVTAETVVNKSGAVVSDLVFTYTDDSRGNWTKQEALQGGVLIRTVDREIIYEQGAAVVTPKD